MLGYTLERRILLAAKSGTRTIDFGGIVGLDSFFARPIHQIFVLLVPSTLSTQEQQEPMKLLLYRYLYLSTALFHIVQAVFHLGIRKSFMIAHSFHDHPKFGPAGGLHGATYTCDVEFEAEDIDSECNWVIDIGMASEMVAAVLKRYNYKNLDEVFGANVMTTTEFMARQIHRDICERLVGGPFRGSICVKLWESHKAWASYTGKVE